MRVRTTLRSAYRLKSSSDSQGELSQTKSSIVVMGVDPSGHSECILVHASTVRPTWLSRFASKLWSSFSSEFHGTPTSGVPWKLIREHHKWAAWHWSESGCVTETLYNLKSKTVIRRSFHVSAYKLGFWFFFFAFGCTKVTPESVRSISEVMMVTEWISKTPLEIPSIQAANESCLAFLTERDVGAKVYSLSSKQE